MEASQYEQPIFSNDIVLRVEQVTPTSMTLNIENLTNEDLIYGVDYELEYFDDSWQQFDVGPIAVILIAKMLPAHGFVQEELEWSHTYGTLAPGKYRIVKRIGPHIAAATFHI